MYTEYTQMIYVTEPEKLISVLCHHFISVKTQQSGGAVQFHREGICRSPGCDILKRGFSSMLLFGLESSCTFSCSLPTSQDITEYIFFFFFFSIRFIIHALVAM